MISHFIVITYHISCLTSQAKLLRKRIASALRRAADAHHATIDLEIARVLQRREARLFLGEAAMEMIR